MVLEVIKKLIKKLVTITQAIFLSFGFSNATFAQKEYSCSKGVNYSNKNLIIVDYHGKSETSFLKNILYCKSFSASVKKLNQLGTSVALPALISKANGVLKFVLKAENFNSFLPVPNGQIMNQSTYSEELPVIGVNTYIDYQESKGVSSSVSVKFENSEEISVSNNPAAELISPTIITISGNCPEKLVTFTPKSSKDCDFPMFPGTTQDIK